jgi:PKD repeat protein
MKMIINPRLATTALLALLFAACNKPEIPIQNTLTNTEPFAFAGGDITIRLPNSAILDGSASTDRENNITSFKWELGYGPSTVNIVNPNLAKTEVKFSAKGNYRFSLIVTDTKGRHSGSYVNVMVLDTQLLNIKAVKDTTIQLPYNLALLSAAGDEIETLDLNWKKISGPNSFNIESPNSIRTIISGLVEGVYQFEINATNSMQTTVKDTVTVTVLADNNIYTSEKLFENIVWANGDSSFSFTIKNISSIIPAGHPFKVYLKSGAEWQLVVPDGQVPNELYYYYRYHFFINDNRLVVYFGHDPYWDEYVDIASKDAIKIVY